MRIACGILLCADVDGPDMLAEVGNSYKPASKPAPGTNVNMNPEDNGIKLHLPPSGRRTSKNQRLSSCRHSTTFTISSSSRAFFRSTFIGKAVTRPGVPSRRGKGSHIVQSSSISGTSTPFDSRSLL